MSILIKGMEMPKNCSECPLVVCLSVESDCPLVPVPPHGRLIDADALMLKILDYIEEYSDVDEKGWHNLKWCAMKEAEMAINDAETVLNSTR